MKHRGAPSRGAAACLAVVVCLLASASSAYALGEPLVLTPPSISGSIQQGQTVTCSTGTWLNSPTSYSYTWQRNVTTQIGTGNTYTLTAADVGQAITCTVVASNLAGSSLPAVSAPVVPLAAVAGAPVETTPPTISGTAQQGQTVTCSTGSWTNSPTGYTYSWQRNGSDIGGATSSQYTLTSADVDQAITCTVIASNASGSSAPATSAPITPIALPVPPVNSSPPVISGSAQQGQTVTCSQGSWLNDPTSFAYSWQRNGSGISGETSSSYTLTNSDVNQAITCTVIATNPSGSSAPAVSAPITPVALPVGLAPVETLPPAISGSPEEGQTVSCSTGTWTNSPTGYSYSWQRNATDIGGATSSQYTLSSADVNQAITCTVVATNGSGSSAPAVSTPIVPIALPAIPVETGPPAISGSPEQGQTVTCSTGAWLNDPTSYAYTWQRSGSNIAGATSSTYSLTSADVNQAVTCTVVASNGAGSGLPAVSIPIVPVALPSVLVPIELTPPTISGSPEEGETVACSPGSWLNSPTGYSYSWQRTTSAIAGATSSSYTLTASDVGQVITCTVVAHNGSGDSAPAISPPIVPVALPLAAVPIESSPPVIAGSPEEGRTVSCSPGQWSNGPTSYSYTWQRTGVAIGGATGSSYTLSGSDVGQAISCTVVAHNSAGNSAPAISLPILPVGFSNGNGDGNGPGSSHGGIKLKPPTIEAFSVVSGKMTIVVRGRRRSTKGATFRFTLDRAAGVLIAVEERQTGRINGGACVAANRRNMKARHCTRWVTVKLLAVKSARAGTDQLRYAGRVGTRLLALGGYRAVAAAVNTGGWSRSRSALFRVVRKSAKAVRMTPGRHGGH